MKENCKKQQNKNKQRQKGGYSERVRGYSERVRAKWFCCAFKLGFLQLICQASLIFLTSSSPHFCWFWDHTLELTSVASPALFWPAGTLLSQNYVIMILSVSGRILSPHEKINQCFTNVNQCLTNIFKI